ncbi:endonuclease/exonuclease/phosphatase family protein [Microbacteriaceae bacterium 4G12]
MIGPAERDTLHVATYNIRYAKPGVPTDTPDNWSEREQVLARWLQIERPTILGVQEALFPQLASVAHALPPSYRSVGIGRDGGSRGEFGSIFYAAARLTLLSYDFLWLSDTPEVMGSATWGNTVPRMITEARFLDSATGIEFAVLNTHLDHEHAESRTLGARAIAERIASTHADVPVLVMGDFNAPAERSEPYALLTEGAGLRDAWHAAKRRVTAGYGTFADYRRPVEGGDRIDWLLASDRVEVLTAAIDPFAWRGRTASDHLPVQALVRLH